MKAELSDIEGLGFRLEERQQDILQLKKSLKLKVRRNSVVFVIVMMILCWILIKLLFSLLLGQGT